MRSSRFALFALFLVLGVAGPARRACAAWPAGLTLESVQGAWNGGLGGVNEGYLLPGASPGELYAIGCNTGSFRWSVHRFTTDGVSFYQVVPNLSGICLPGGSDLAGIPLAPDGAGGCLYAYHYCSPSRLRSAHLDAAGTLFPTTGYSVDSLAYSPATTLTAPGGGAWYAWPFAGVKLMRVNVNGVPLPSWPARGWRVPGLPSPQVSFYYGLSLASDDAGGVFITSADTVVRVQRVGPDTTIAPGWPAAGVQLRTPGSAQFGIAPTATVIASNDPYYFVAWIEGWSTYQVYLQRFSRDGAVDPAWPAAGRLVGSGAATEALDTRRFRCFPDGTGGVTVTWTSQTGGAAGCYARHVLADGSFATGYEGGAKNIADAGAAVCAGRDGGLIACWVAPGLPPGLGLRGRWYDANGAPDPSPEIYESDLSADIPGRNPRRTFSALSDGEGGAYLLFEYMDDQVMWIGGAIAHVTQHSVADVPPAGAPRALALAVSPNPARGAFTARFTLPDDHPATLDLLDIGGRRAWSCEVRGPGEQSLAIEPAGTLAPGVYLVRLEHRGLSRTKRVTIVH